MGNTRRGLSTSARNRVKVLVLSDGERLPVLLGLDGQPLLCPTLYSVSELRARNLAANTIANALRAILVFQLFLDLRGINLEARLDDAQVLSVQEVEDLISVCRLPTETLFSLIERSDEASEPKTSHASVLSFEKHRVRASKPVATQVSPAAAATRLQSIRDHLTWLVSVRLSQHGQSREYRTALTTAGERTTAAIKARSPIQQRHASGPLREGLPPETISLLFEIVAPDSPGNPWPDVHSRRRNALAIHWLFHLGLRRGELLGVRVTDIDFRKGTVVIARRADDPKDPRRYQPTVKTRAREVPLSSGLLDMTRDYVMTQRTRVGGSRKHDFLLVSSADGQPLSIPAFNKIFSTLRQKCPGLPRNLSAHVLRHTWNDRFSEEMDRRNVAEETEKKTRSYLMGWSKSSGTAAVYTRRHIRTKAQEALRTMQERLLNEVSGEE